MGAAQNILYVASHGMEDSYRATLIFAAANAAVKKGVAVVRVALLGEATWLAHEEIAKNFSLGQLTGRDPLSKLIETFRAYAEGDLAKATIGV